MIPTALPSETARAELAARRRAAHDDLAEARATAQRDLLPVIAAHEEALAEARRLRAEWQAAERKASQIGAGRLKVTNGLGHAERAAENALQAAADPAIALARELLHRERARVEALDWRQAGAAAVGAARLELVARLRRLDALPLEDLSLDDLDAQLFALLDTSTLPTHDPQPATAGKE